MIFNRNIFKVKLFLITTIVPLFLHASCSNNNSNVISALVPRSQERHRPQQLVGLCEKTYLLDAGPFYGTASLTGAYAKTFKSDHIAQAFFGPALFCADNCNPYIKIQGNAYQGEDRDPKALLADYFYLPQDYSGTVAFEPRIKNYSADIDLYFGLNNVCEGLYLRIHSPLVHTDWDLEMREKIITQGSLDYPTGYFTPNFLPATTLLSRFSQYGCGKAPSNGTINQFGGDIVVTGGGNFVTTDFVVTLQGLQHAKLCCAEKKTRLADIRIELGKIFAETEHYSVGAHLECAIPTGTKKKGIYLFEPVIGNGHHWEFGGGIHGKYVWYNSHRDDIHTTLYADFNVTHLFKTDQKRTFDLKNKPLSRYMLATYFTPGVVDLTTEIGIVPSAQFAQKYAPLANISTLDVSVACDIQIDGSAFVHYHRKKWDFDCGYNIWYRSQEQIKCKPTTPCCDQELPLCDPQNKNRWALKGDARMYGFQFEDGGLANIIPLSATENNATIYNGTNQATVDCTDANTNTLIDNPQEASSQSTTSALIICPNGDDFIRVNTSLDPIFLQCSDLDIKGTRGLSHTVFAHTSYTGEWKDYNPYFGIGGSAEFGMHDDENKMIAISQWTVWIKGGFTFD